MPTPRKPVSKKHVPAELTDSAKKKAAKAGVSTGRRTTSKDVPGNGMAKNAAKAIEAHKRRLRDI